MALMSLFSGQQWRNRHKNRPKDMGEGRRERMRCMERVTWKFTVPYIKQIASGNLLCDSGNSNRGSVARRVRWGGRWEGGLGGRGHGCTYG